MWNGQDYTSNAEGIARAFMSGLGMGGSPLVDLVEKTARDHALNPEQIRRLSAITNRAVFSEKYAAAKGNPDRRVDFEIVDADDVIGRIQGSAKTASATVARPALYPDLPDPRAERLAKFAAEIPSPAHASTKPAKHFANIQKLANELPIEMRMLDDSWVQDTVALAALFGKHAMDAHRDFELNALGVLGADVLVELNGVRSKLGMTLIPDSDRAKYAEAQAHVYGVADENTARLKRAMATRDEYATAHVIKGHVDQEKADMLRAVRGG